MSYYIPLSIDASGVPTFSSLTLELYGPPSLFGYENFQVIESRETASPSVMDWQQEQDCRGNIRPIHRYNRTERFEFSRFT
jgi:hypothetical protein